MLVARGLPDESKDRAVEAAQMIGEPYVRALARSAAAYAYRMSLRLEVRTPLPASDR